MSVRPDPSAAKRLSKEEIVKKKWKCTLCGYIHTGETPTREMSRVRTSAISSFSTNRSVKSFFTRRFSSIIRSQDPRRVEAVK